MLISWNPYPSISSTPRTTVFLGILYPQNVQKKCPSSTTHREKGDNGRTKMLVRQLWIGAPKALVLMFSVLTQSFVWHHINLLTPPFQQCLAKDATRIEKRSFLAQIDERQLSGETVRSCCRHFDLKPSQVRQWRKLKEDLSNPEAANKALLHSGRVSILSGLEEQLLSWFFELQEQGIMVTVQSITLRASKLCDAFRRKSIRAKELIRQFLAQTRPSYVQLHMSVSVLYIR